MHFRCTIYLLGLCSLYTPITWGAEAATPLQGDMLVATISINSVAKGEFFVFIDTNNHYWIRQEDAVTLGLKALKHPPQIIEGEPRLSLNAIDGLTIKFDSKTLGLELQSAPELLGRTTIDFSPQRRPEVQRPNNNSAFINYRLNYSGTANTDSGSIILNTDVGLRLSSWLVTSGLVYQHRNEESSVVRLLSSLTYDRRDDLQRFTIGDFFTDTPQLGSGFNLGGINFAKRYTMDPYLPHNPGANLSGSVALPSTAEIYLEGIKVGSVPLNPGEFSLENLNYFGGARDLQLVITDRFGKKQTLKYDFYFSNAPLRQGLHEYSYSAGLQRLNFGSPDSTYGKWGAAFLHRYGATDWLTLGLHGEAETDYYNIANEGVLRLNLLGTLNATWAQSELSSHGSGTAQQLNYEYQTNGYALHILARQFSAKYAMTGTPATTTSARLPRSELGIGVNFGYPHLGNLGLEYRVTQPRATNVTTQTTTMRYSVALPGKINLFATLGRTESESASYEFMLGLAWNPDSDITTSALHSTQRGTTSNSLSINKNAAEDNGFGYSLGIEDQQSSDESSRTATTFLQYNGPYGIYTADYHHTVTSNDNAGAYELTAAGGMGYADGYVGFSRPIADSFAIIQVSDLKDIRVYQNNELVGRTDARGQVFAPNLGSFVDNTLSVEDADIPIEYSLATKQHYLSPPWRSGSVVKFAAHRIQAIIGHIMLRQDKNPLPLEFVEGQIVQDDKVIIITTGRRGEFYLENLPPSTYQATISHDTGTCSFVLTVPQSTEMFVDVGEVWCEPMAP